MWGHLASLEACDIRQSTPYTSVSLLEVNGMNLIPLILSGYLLCGLQIPEIFVNHFSYINICIYCIINVWSVNTILHLLYKRMVGVRCLSEVHGGGRNLCFQRISLVKILVEIIIVSGHELLWIGVITPIHNRCIK